MCLGRILYRRQVRTRQWSQIVRVAIAMSRYTGNHPPPPDSPGSLTGSDYVPPSPGSPAGPRLPMAGPLSPPPPYPSQPGPSEDRFLSPPGSSVNPDILSSTGNLVISRHCRSPGMDLEIHSHRIRSAFPLNLGQALESQDQASHFWL